MSEAVIGVVVGGLLGVIAMVVGTLVNYRLRQEERKSESRREAREPDLEMVGDAVDAFMELVGSIRWSSMWEEDLTAEARAALGRETYLIAWRVRSAPLSLGDEQLIENYSQLRSSFNRWWDLLDLDTGKAKEGRQVEFKESRSEVEQLAGEVRRRIRELREEC